MYYVYVSRTKNNVAVYTGVHGRLTLPDASGALKEIYLFEDSDSRPYIHVPLHFWKVLHDSETNRAVAFVGVNNPHLTETPDTLCQNR